MTSSITVFSYKTEMKKAGAKQNQFVIYKLVKLFIWFIRTFSIICVSQNQIKIEMYDFFPYYKFSLFKYKSKTTIMVTYILFRYHMLYLFADFRRSKQRKRHISFQCDRRSLDIGSV